MRFIKLSGIFCANNLAGKQINPKMISAKNGFINIASNTVSVVPIGERYNKEWS